MWYSFCSSTLIRILGIWVLQMLLCRLISVMASVLVVDGVIFSRWQCSGVLFKDRLQNKNIFSILLRKDGIWYCSRLRFYIFEDIF